MQSISERLARYSPSLAPLREAAERYLRYPSTVTEGGIIKIGNRPWVATLNFLLTLYPGLGQENQERYAQRFGIEIPQLYSNVLREVNGGFCFGMSLCGIPLSMLAEPPGLDRTTLQCHDLATAATRWVKEYRLPGAWFHFGSRDFSYTETVGYFIDQASRILCVRKTGEIVGQWTDFATFLANELPASEQLEETLHPPKWNG